MTACGFDCGDDAALPQRRGVAVGHARAGVAGRSGRGRGSAALQGGEPRGHLRLAVVVPERPLVIGQRLGLVAGVLANLAQRGQRPGIVGLNGQGLDQMLLGRLAVAELVVQPGQLDLGVGRSRLTLDPALDQPKGLFVAPLLGQQHGQPAVAVGVVGVSIQAEIVVGFGLIEVGLAVFEPADAMIGGREIVVGVGVVRVGVGRLLKLFGGLLVSGLLEEPDALGVSPLGVEPAAAGQPQEDPASANPSMPERRDETSDQSDEWM